jgi:hypothetical protein
MIVNNNEMHQICVGKDTGKHTGSVEQHRLREEVGRVRLT